MVRSNKKGSLQDLIFIMIVVVVFAFIALIGFKVVSSINTEMQGTSTIQENDNAKTSFNSIRNLFPGVIDNAFLLLVVGLVIVSLVLASRLAIPPVFLVFFLIIFVIVVFIAGVLSNVYLEAANQTELATEAEELSFITHVTHALPFILGILGFVLAFIMYKNWRDSV